MAGGMGSTQILPHISSTVIRMMIVTTSSGISVWKKHLMIHGIIKTSTAMFMTDVKPHHWNPQVRMQIPEWQVTLHLYVWQFVQVWGNSCTCYLLTQHCWVNLKAFSSAQTQTDEQILVWYFFLGGGVLIWNWKKFLRAIQVKKSPGAEEIFLEDSRIFYFPVFPCRGMEDLQLRDQYQQCK